MAWKRVTGNGRAKKLGLPIERYKQAEQLFATARDKAYGKPLLTGTVLRRDGEDYVLKLCGGEVCRWHPNDTVTFTISDTRRNYALPNVIMKHVGIWFHRSRKAGVYRMATELERGMGGSKLYAKQAGSVNEHRAAWNWLRTDAPAYFSGICFDLRTQRCVNPQPDMMMAVIPEARKVYLADVKHAKKVLRAAAKIGAFEAMWPEVSKLIEDTATKGWNQGGAWIAGNLMGLEALPKTVEMLKAREVPEALFHGVVAMQSNWQLKGGRYPGTPVVYKLIDSLFADNSVVIRQAYGVFSGDHVIKPPRVML